MWTQSAPTIYRHISSTGVKHDRRCTLVNVPSIGTSRVTDPDRTFHVNIERFLLISTPVSAHSLRSRSTLKCLGRSRPRSAPALFNPPRSIIETRLHSPVRGPVQRFTRPQPFSHATYFCFVFPQIPIVNAIGGKSEAMKFYSRRLLTRETARERNP